VTSPDYITQAQDAARMIETCPGAGNLSGAMAQLARCNHALCNLAPLLIEEGVKAGLSQRRMAELLDVPASALRGAKREFAS
jgi:cystathionine beta-lyase family protein involved in aluminum resistance